MASIAGRRRGGAHADYTWPGYVDALASLLMAFVFLLSFYVDVDETLARLAGLGLGGEPRRIEVPGMGGAMVPMAVVRDPDGVIVELIGA